MRGIYIAHPIGGDVKKNVEAVCEIVQQLWNEGGDLFPIAPYITPLTLEWDDDTKPLERARGLLIDCEYVKFASELWLYGDRISAGMWQEVAIAMERKIPIRCMTDGTARDWKTMFRKSATK